jgi:opacity protein-like surface antigen
MTNAIKAGLSLAALALFAAPVSAADLGGSRGGSMKDGGYRSAAAGEPVYAAPAQSAAGNCYFRGDMGYSWSKNPDIKSPFGDLTNFFTDTVDPVTGAVTRTSDGSNYVQNGEAVTDTHMGNGGFGEVGIGCGSGSRGIRAEVMLGYHGSKSISGKPGDFRIFENVTTVTGPTTTLMDNVGDPLHTTLKSYTMMLNAYKDLGNFGGITPYVGAGIGLAYNRIGETTFTETTTRHNTILGHDDLAFAWSLMAGVGYQLSDRAVLDVGYRYLDLGKATSDSVDNTRAYNPRIRFDDLASHEIKVGIRYHFGQGAADMPAYAPMK